MNEIDPYLPPTVHTWGCRGSFPRQGDLLSHAETERACERLEQLMANYSIGVQGPGGHNAFLIAQHIKTLAEGFDLQDHQPIRQLCDRLTSFGEFRYAHAVGGDGWLFRLRSVLQGRDPESYRPDFALAWLDKPLRFDCVVVDDCGATIIEVTSIQKGPQGQGLERQLERKLAILRAVLGFAVGEANVRAVVVPLEHQFEPPASDVYDLLTEPFWEYQQELRRRICLPSVRVQAALLALDNAAQPVERPLAFDLNGLCDLFCQVHDLLEEEIGGAYDYTTTCTATGLEERI